MKWKIVPCTLEIQKAFTLHRRVILPPEGCNNNLTWYAAMCNGKLYYAHQMNLSRVLEHNAFLSTDVLQDLKPLVITNYPKQPL
jgi:hypothetical protein